MVFLPEPLPPEITVTSCPGTEKFIMRSTRLSSKLAKTYEPCITFFVIHLLVKKQTRTQIGHNDQCNGGDNRSGGCLAHPFSPFIDLKAKPGAGEYHQRGKGQTFDQSRNNIFLIKDLGHAIEKHFKTDIEIGIGGGCPTGNPCQIGQYG